MYEDECNNCTHLIYSNKIPIHYHTYTRMHTHITTYFTFWRETWVHAYTQGRPDSHAYAHTHAHNKKNKRNCLSPSLSLCHSLCPPDAGDASLLAVLVAVEYPAVGYSSFLRAHREWVCVRVCVYVCPPDVVGRSNGLPQRISSESWRICD